MIREPFAPQVRWAFERYHKRQETMMNIYERIVQDHDKHRELAAQIMKTEGNSEERNELWQQFKPEAVAHANAEEQTFYAELIEARKSQEQARHSVHEHKEADDLIQELDEMDMSSSGWIQKFEKLKDELEHHMDEEENDVFEIARKVISNDLANDLVDKFEKRKRSEISENA